MGEAGLRLRRSHWARDGHGLRLWTLPSDRAHVYPDVQGLEQPWRMAVPTRRDAPGPTPGHGGPAALRDDGVLAGPDLEFRAFCARRGLGCLAGRAIPARRDRPAAGLHRQPVPATLTARVPAFRKLDAVAVLAARLLPAPGDERGSMARDYRRRAAATRALVAAHGDHYMIAVSRRASAHPERVDHQIDMPAPVEPWPRAHRAAHAAHQHPDVDRLYVGTDRPRAPGASGQLCDDRDQLVLLGLRFRLPISARQRVLNPDVRGGRLRDTAQQPLDQCERFSVGLERLARPLGEEAERLTDQLR